MHLFTASGVVLALLALRAVEQGDELAALAWLGVALVVDGVDGTLARAAKVRERVPNIDGDALDLVVDYLTYVFVPALLMWRGHYLPEALALPITAVILLSSLYVFARHDMKTDDGYFRGFPALWNVVALYVVALDPAPSLTAAAIVLLAAATFAPIHVPHPFRATDYGVGLPAIAILWATAAGGLLISGVGSTFRFVLVVVSALSAVALAGMGLVRTARGSRTQ